MNKTSLERKEQKVPLSERTSGLAELGEQLIPIDVLSRLEQYRRERDTLEEKYHADGHPDDPLPDDKIQELMEKYGLIGIFSKSAFRRTTKHVNQSG